MKPVPESQTLSVDTTVGFCGVDLVGITTQLVPASRQTDKANGTVDLQGGLMGEPGHKIPIESTR